MLGVFTCNVLFHSHNFPKRQSIWQMTKLRQFPPNREGQSKIHTSWMHRLRAQGSWHCHKEHISYTNAHCSHLTTQQELQGEPCLGTWGFEYGKKCFSETWIWQNPYMMPCLGWEWDEQWKLVVRQNTAVKCFLENQPACITTNTHTSFNLLSSLSLPSLLPFCPWSGLTLQKLRNLFQLGNVIFAEATVLFQKWEDVIVLIASMGFIQGLQGPEYHPPCILFFLRIFHLRYGLTTRIQAWNICLQQGRCKEEEEGALAERDRCRVSELLSPGLQGIS